MARVKPVKKRPRANDTEEAALDAPMVDSVEQDTHRAASDKPIVDGTEEDTPPLAPDQPVPNGTEGNTAAAPADANEVEGTDKADVSEKKARPRQKRPSSAVKRPLNAYMIFFQQHLKQEPYKEMKVTETARAIASLWKELDDEGKKPYAELAIAAKEEYQTKLKAQEV